MKIKAFVVGLHHYHDDLVFDTGMPVSVVFDEENEHSECAFKVLTEGGLFGGYLAESQYYWGKLANRLGAKLSFEIKALVNQGYNISEAVVKEIRGRALKYTKVVLEITLNEPIETSEEVSEEMEEDNMSVEVIGDKEGLYTLVGVQYYTNKVEIGSKVLLTLKNNTTFGINEMGEDIGVFPQKDSKCAQVEALGLPLEKNSDIKNNGVAFEREYIVVGFITETKGNKVSKYCVIQKSVVEAEIEVEPVVEEIDKVEVAMSEINQYETLKEFCNDCGNPETTLGRISIDIEALDLEMFVNNGFRHNRKSDLSDNELMKIREQIDKKVKELEENWTPEPVVEEETVDEVSVEAETEAEMKIDEMEINEVLANDVTLKQWVAERNRLVNEVSDLNEQLRKLEAELEYTEAKIGERVEAMTLIHQIKDKLSSLDIENLRKIHNEVINDSASSDDEEDTSSSFNEEITNNGGLNMEEKYEYSIIFEKGDEEIVKFANEVNDILIQMVDNSPLKGEPTMLDISGISEDTVYARLDFNISDLETPNLEKKICDTVRTILHEKHLIFSMDTMPNVDAEDGYYYYPIEIKQ